MIKDFNFYAPTRVVFGSNAEKQIGSLVSAYGGHKILLHYGGEDILQKNPAEMRNMLIERLKFVTA